MSKIKTLEMYIFTSKIKKFISSKKLFLLLIVFITVLIKTESYFHKRIVKIIESKVSDLINEKSIPVTFKNIDYGYAPPRVILKDLKLVDSTRNFKAKKTVLYSKLIPLIKLKASLKTLKLEDAILNWNLKESETSFEKIDFESILELIPAEKIHLKNSSIQFSNDEFKMDFRKLNLKLTKYFKYLKVDLSCLAQIKNNEVDEIFSLNVMTSINEDSTYIKYLNLQKEDTIVKTSGSFITKKLLNQNLKNININTLYNISNELSLNALINLSDLSSTLNNFYKGDSYFDGEIQSSIYYNKDNKNKKSKLKFTLNNIVTPKLILEKANIDLDLAPKALEIKDTSYLKLTKDSKISFKHSKIIKKDDSYFADLNFYTNNFNLKDIFKTLTLPHELYDSPLKNKSKCEGRIHPKINLNCKGNANVSYFELLLDNKNFLTLGNLSTDYEVDLTDKDLEFKSNPYHLSPDGKKYTGTVNGFVDYVKGFDINYKTELLDLNFLENIANQNLRGLISAEGNTKGSSEWGKFYLDLNKGTELYYDNIFLGNGKARVSYKSSQLKVTDANGTIGDNGSYEADLSFDTSKNDLLLYANGTGIDSDSFRQVFKELFDFPEDIYFTKTNFKLKLSGEPNIEKFNMDLTAKSPSLNFYGENFKDTQFSMSGEDGVWSVENSFFEKQNSKFRASGNVFGFKTIDLKLKNTDLNLEEVDRLKMIGLNLKGPAIFQLNAKGPINGPKAYGKIQLKNTLNKNNFKLGDSNIGYRLLKEQIELQGDVFSDKITGSGVYPFTEQGFFSFTGKVDNFDLFKILSLENENSVTQGLPISFESDVRIKNKLSKFFISGWIDQFRANFYETGERILDIESRRKISFLKNSEPLIIKSGDDFISELTINTKRDGSINLNINGEFEAGALQNFIPETEILSGEVNFKNLKMSVDNTKIDYFGDVLVQNATFKNSSFPYSITDINTLAKFRKNQISFKKVNARVNNKPLTFSGKINTDNFYLNILLEYTDLELEYPKDIFSKTNGNLNIYGSRFPLKAKGKVTVLDGEFRKDLLTDSEGKNITANKFLPNLILYKNAPPFDLDIDLYINKNYVIKSSEINGFTSGQIKLQGNAFNPITDGYIELKKGMNISFLDKVFTVEEGRLIYTKSYLENPELYVDATTEVTDNNDITSNKYLIRMLTEGTADELKFSFSSKPSLAEKEVISLLTLGTVSTQSIGQEINTQQQATYSGFQVGSFLLQKNKGIRELQKKTGTEIGISSSVDAFNVNPKVHLKKKWSPKLSSTVSQTFGNQQTLSLSTEYKVNKRVSTSFSVENNQTQDATQLLNRQVQQGEIFGLDLQYKFDFQ